jgi:RNA polymerase sigma-70 factor (ECF subfamily)
MTRPALVVTEPADSHLSEEGRDEPAGSAALVRRAASGERAALERLLVQAQEVAWRFGRAVCGQDQDAEDAMQEALIKTYQHIDRIRDPEAFRPWLYRTVRNACLMSRRRRQGQPSRVLSLDEVLPDTMRAHEHAPGASVAALRSPETIVVNAGLRRRLTEAMRKLPAEFRAVVFLREMEGLSTRETAQVLRVSEDNVKARLHRARLVLQKELRDWSQPEEPAGAARRVPRTSKKAGRQ